MTEALTGAENLKSLGESLTKYPTSPDEAELEAIPNLNQDNDYVVNLDCHEFTCVCPKTHQPDFAELEITYIPGEHLVESKSLKLYLFSYRNHGIFHEFVVNKIAKDLVKAIKPKYIRVQGNFSPRGGIAIVPVVELGDLELGRKLV